MMLFSGNVSGSWLMKTRNNSIKTTLKPILDLAKVLGELGYRQSLVKEELKTIEHRTPRKKRAWIKKAESAGRKYLVREHFLAQEWSEELGRLEVEIQLVMNEKIDRLTKRLEVSGA